MKNQREGIHGLVEKARQVVRVLKPENNKAIVKVSEFRFINIPRINELLGTDFKVAIIDIDECIAPHHRDILQKNIEAIQQMVQQGIQIVVYSNHGVDKRYDPLVTVVREAGGELYIHDSAYAKPDKKGFDELIAKLHLTAKNFLMIGDNLDTDGGSIRAGIPFALITKPVKGGSKLSSTLRFVTQIAPRWIGTKTSAYHDRKYHRTPLTDTDFTA